MKVKLLFTTTLVLACSVGASAQAKQVRAVASFTILADVVKNVGGDNVDVTSLIGTDGDPHDFEPSPKDVKMIQKADVVFASGLHLEPWLGKLVRSANKNKQAVIVSEGINTRMMDHRGKEVSDPHVWNSAKNVEIWVDHIEKALSEVDPNHANAYKSRANDYREKLRALDAWIHEEYKSIPKNQRRVLTGHDAFGYYARDYHVTFLAPEGISTAAEPSAATVASLIDEIKAKHVEAYFTENSNNKILVAQIAKATGAYPGGKLYPESLSDKAGPASTYMNLMRHNTEQIVAALKAK